MTSKRFPPPKTVSQMKCMGKRGHESQRKAQALCDRSLAERNVALYPYRCRECKQWHLTHIPPEQQFTPKRTLQLRASNPA